MPSGTTEMLLKVGAAAALVPVCAADVRCFTISGNGDAQTPQNRLSKSMYCITLDPKPASGVEATAGKRAKAAHCNKHKSRRAAHRVHHLKVFSGIDDSTAGGGA